MEAARSVSGLNLDHGADPAVLAHDRGFVVVRPLDAVRDETGDLVLKMLVRPLGEEPRPLVRGRGQDRTLPLTDDLAPMVRQRVAAYAVVLSTRGLLATQFSAVTAVPGRWGMPGGGLDDHEQPAAAVLREVIEETSQTIVLGDLAFGTHLPLDRPQSARSDRRLPCHPAGLSRPLSVAHRPGGPGLRGHDSIGPLGAAGYMAESALDAELAGRAFRVARSSQAPLTRVTNPALQLECGRPGPERQIIPRNAVSGRLMDVVQQVLARQDPHGPAVVQDEQRIAVNQDVYGVGDRLRRPQHR